MKKIILSLLTLFLVSSFVLTAQTREKFDPGKDPIKDVKAAVKIASKTNKNILLDVGGEWCPWCHRLDEFILADKEIDGYLHSNFVEVKVNYSKENENKKFLSTLPKVKGYPHLFVLDKKGKLIQSQDTGELEQEKSYSKEKLMAFLKKYSPKKK
jgi:thioredoxin-related protein